MKHYWNGQWVQESELDARLEGLFDDLPAELELDIPRETLLKACGVLCEHLAEGQPLRQKVMDRCSSRPDVADAIEEVREFFQPAALELKLKREFKEPDPEIFERVDLSEPIFEAWAPLGLLVHVAPANALSVGPFTVLEGLLAGNLNLLKVPGSDPPFGATILEGLVEASDGVLAPFIKVVSFASSHRERLQTMMDAADGVAVWGGEAAVESVSQMVRPGVRVIDWGHKISFAYLSVGHWEDEKILEALALDCCKYDQQLCTSPQAIYLQTDKYSDLQAFARKFAPILERVSSECPSQDMDDKDWAELTSICEIHKREGVLGEVQCEVVEPQDRAWRLLLDERPALMPSPLFRTVWVKPLPLKSIVATLRPMRRYLQTVGLSSGPEHAAQLVRRLVQAGAERVTTAGRMLESYPGEAHDGVYSLQRYSRRTGLRLGDWAARMSSLSEIDEPPNREIPAGIPIMTKQDFQAQEPDPAWAQLYFHSGGSSGAPKLSCFAYEDFAYHLSLGAEGLFAAGLNPTSDRCMNLFFAGDLYAGFLCTYVILERLKAVQFPMTALEDYDEVAKTVEELKVNTLLGMPSYIVELFRSHGNQLGSVRKIFYAGEHFSEAQRLWLQEEHRVELIRSLAYGSVDVGFQGYQCAHTAPGVHHLHSRIQALEILHPDKDEPVADGEVGRLVFTSAHRRGQTVLRYEPGDLGRWVEGPCPCGRTAPMFALLGRHGDVFRIGTNFFNYRVFPQLLAEHFHYTGPVQIVLASGDPLERVELRIETGEDLNAETVRATLIEKEPNLKESVLDTKLLDFRVEVIGPEAFEHSSSSGKLKEVIERRKV
jgi:phenylacetate-coenzyme A ligase PaaK-like adenylate-forming protein